MPALFVVTSSYYSAHNGREEQRIKFIALERSIANRKAKEYALRAFAQYNPKEYHLSGSETSGTWHIRPKDDRDDDGEMNVNFNVEKVSEENVDLTSAAARRE